jgi:hypothetical protein
VKRMTSSADVEYDLQGMLRYLSTASNSSVESVELAKLAEESNLRRKVLDCIEDWIHCRTVRVFAALIKEQHRDSKGKFKAGFATSECGCPECRCAPIGAGNGAESLVIRQGTARQPSADDSPIVKRRKSREERPVGLALKAKLNSQGKRR